MSLVLLQLFAAAIQAQRAAQASTSYEPFVAEASGEGEAALARQEIPAGFEARLWAAEPMLANPVAFHVDHAGDVYVDETFRIHAGVDDMRDHMDWLEDELQSLTVADRVAMYRRRTGEGFAAYGTEHERIRRLCDTDGDGAADVSVVFADGFNDPADGIAAGVLSYRGDVFYTCIPSLWRLRDKDGDGAADERSRLSDGYGVHVALIGHDMHGIVLGPDGRLYFSIGDRGLHVEHERRVLALPHCGAVLRCELDGSGLELFHTGLRNPQELVFDDRGDLFTGDNNSDGGDEARWVQIVEGADTGWRFYYQYVTAPVMRGPWNDEGLWRSFHAGQPAYVLPPIANLASGPSGLECYPGTGLPDGYAGHFFLCDFRGDAQHSGIYTFTQTPKGAGFELGPVERFVWKTLATDCQLGPDGGFYYSDWVHGWNKTGKGRIYRLEHPASVASAAARETKELLTGGFDQLGERRLGELLAHADRRVRQEAELELARRGAWQELARAATEESGLARLHGVWGLGVIARRAPAARWELEQRILPLLDDRDAEVRAQAARVLGDLRSHLATTTLERRLSDDEARVRMHAAIGLGRIRAPSSTVPLLELAARTGESDPVLRHAAIMGLAGCATDEALLACAREPDRHVRMAALLALRRRGHPGLARSLDDPDPMLVREAAIAIHDERIEAALPALAAMLERPGLTGNPLVRRALNAAMWLGDDEQDARRIAAFALRDDQEPGHRAEALRILGEWADPSNIDRVLGRWIELSPRDASYVPGVLAELAGKMRSVPEPVLVAWIEVSGACRADVAPALALIARTSELARARAAAVRSLEALAPPDLGTVVAFALADGDGHVRAAGLDALQRLSPAEALPLLQRVALEGELAERRVAYRALGELGASGHSEATLALAGELQRLRSELVPAELELDLVLAAEASGAEELRRALDAHAAPRAADPKLAPWLDCLFGGDAKAGERIFRESTKLSCLRCHQADGEQAARIGPDLTGLGERLSRLQMLEAIVAPNRRVPVGYATTMFFLVSGDVIEGRVVGETADSATVLDSAGNLRTVALADVEERRPGLSAMPQGLGDSISREEMRDLLAYLGSL